LATALWREICGTLLLPVVGVLFKCYLVVISIDGIAGHGLFMSASLRQEEEIGGTQNTADRDKIMARVIFGLPRKTKLLLMNIGISTLFIPLSTSVLVIVAK
jgi:hypothetical protein